MAKPKIRFKGFSEDWEQRKLGDIIIEYKETVDSDCTLPILTSSKTEGVILQEEHFGRKQQHDITGYNILPRNYCTYRNRSDGVDFTFNINKCCDKGIISKFYPVFSGKNSDVFFLSLVLNNSEEVVREIAYTCTGTGQKVLSFLDLQKMKVRVPNFDEQKEIAAYFESLDHLITLHQRKCDEIKTLKKYMLQKMFPEKGKRVPEIRFDGFTEDWEQRKLGDITNSLEYGLNAAAKEYDGENKYIRITDIDDDTHEFLRENLTSPDADLIDAENYKLAKGDILFARTGASVGKSYIYRDSDGLVYYAGFLIRARIKEEYDVEFVFQNTLTDRYNKYIAVTSQRSGQPGVNAQEYSELEIQVPEKDEQTKIGEYFSNLDHLITLHHRKYNINTKIKVYFSKRLGTA